MQKTITHAAIVVHPQRDCSALSLSVEKVLRERGVSSIIVDIVEAAPGSADDTHQLLPGKGREASTPSVPSAAELEAVDLAISLGGDGTLLFTARLFYGRGIPVLAVNLGTFGFLTAISHDEVFHALDALFEGRADFEERLMLSCRVRRADKAAGEAQALNEIVVTRRGMSGMVSLDAWVNGEFLCSYRADGLIVSTPTGSTGYSLSASGPILMPSLDNMIINPICPHSVASRPFVVAGNDVITIRVAASRVHPFLAMDMQEGRELEDGDDIEVRRAPHALTLVRSSERSYLEVLRTKLAWNGTPGKK
jgi:NAD+ kinase